MNRRFAHLASSWFLPLSLPSRWLAAILLAGGIAPWAGSARAADTNGTWIVDGNGLWSDLDTANWSGGLVADGASYTADFGAIDIAADRVVSLASARTIGNLIFGDLATSSAAGWTLNNNATRAATSATAAP
jgi:hypothetical protein